MTPLRLAVAVAESAQSFTLRTQLERLCHSVVLEIPPSGLLQSAARESVDLIVLDQGPVAFDEVLARVAGLREVSDLPILIVASKAEPSAVDQLLEWPGTGLVYLPADIRSLYNGIAAAIAAHERERRHRHTIQGLRAMLDGMRGAILSADTHGRTTEISADACRYLGCTAEQALGSRVEELLGIAEPVAMLALRGGEHEIAQRGRHFQLRVVTLGEGDEAVEGWLVRLEETPQRTATSTPDDPAVTRIIPLDSSHPGGAPPFPPAAVLAREYRPQFRPLSLSVLARDLASQTSNATPTRTLRIQVEPNMRVIADEALLREMLELLLQLCRSVTYGLPNGQVRVGQRTTADRTVFYVYDNGRGDDPARNEFFNDRLSDLGYGRVERIVGLHGGVCGFKLDDVGRGATVFFTLPGHRLSTEEASNPATTAA